MDRLMWPGWPALYQCANDYIYTASAVMAMFASTLRVSKLVDVAQVHLRQQFIKYSFSSHSPGMRGAL
jgi:hypothetical protein